VCNNYAGFFRLTRRKPAGIIALFQGISTQADGKRRRKDCIVLGDTDHQGFIINCCQAFCTVNFGKKPTKTTKRVVDFGKNQPPFFAIRLDCYRAPPRPVQARGSLRVAGVGWQGDGSPLTPYRTVPACPPLICSLPVYFSKLKAFRLFIMICSPGSPSPIARQNIAKSEVLASYYFYSLVMITTQWIAIKEI